MKKTLLILLLAPFLFFGCSEKSSNDLLDIDQMAEILSEMQVGHAGVDITITQAEGKLSSVQEINVTILEERNITGASFYSSYEHYQKTPRLMDSIYVRVLSNLEAKLDSLTNEENLEGYPPKNKSKE